MPHACVIGLGKSGIAAAKLLQHQGWQVSVSDSGSGPALQTQQQELLSQGITVKLGDRFQPVPPFPDMLVVSPGVPWDVPGLVQARTAGIETIGEMELAWRFLQHCPWIGITGTNGKTTTTALISAIFQAAGYYAPAFGNIGYAACEVALEALLSSQPQAPAQSSAKAVDWAIAELSSYQIESSPAVAPRIGVWTTFTPDHLARHRTLERYAEIKAHLLRQSQQQILNGDDPYLRQAHADWPDAYWTSVTGAAALPGEPTQGFYLEGGWVMAQGTPVVAANALRMPGGHNQQNLLMSVAAAWLAGIEPAVIAAAIAAFPGVPHRLEHIITWQGIDFINDSKATNYDAAQVGLASVNSPAILIAGGEAKEGNDEGWLATIQAKAVAVLLIGSAAPAFAQRLEQVGYSSYEIVETMERAIPRAAELAKHVHAAIVLLSPACASFDQYQNFEQRGDHFRQLCLEFADS